MRLTHTIFDGAVRQHLLFLDGPKRQVLRQQTLSVCSDREAPQWQLWPRQLDFHKLSAVYDIAIDGLERVADRDAYIIDITPRDNHRYGYRFSIDSETGLLLKTLFIVNEKVIERLQFVELLLYTENSGISQDRPDADSDLSLIHI